ncbi:motility associated factor glycosyltransferase family protein [Shewanella waksmanii]|uniref:motility associated factor glycosyltransferase family protein n=1 Tax=Shewanella waksmanii TaxID=213783 RepID=UPI003736BFC0
MTDLFLTNLSVIEQRWPDLAANLKFTSFNQFEASLVQGKNQTISVDGIQLSSRHDRAAEAKLLINQIPTNRKHVTVYGIGMGDVPTYLTDNEKIEKITVCTLNLSLLALLLSYTDQREWLNDNRVELLYKFPQFQLANDYLCIMPDLQLSDNTNSVIRDILVHENTLSAINAIHEKNREDNQVEILNNVELNNSPDASLLRHSHLNNEAIIIGAGPTLEHHYEYLSSVSSLPLTKRAIIIAVDTALIPLLENNIKPDIVVSIDRKITTEHLPSQIPDSIALVHFPQLDKEVIRKWPGPKYSAYSSASYDDVLHNKVEKLRLFTGGSVIHPTVDLAVFLKATSIHLFGCDFCFANDKTHALWKDGALGPGLENSKHWVVNGLGQRAKTYLNLRGYLRSLEVYIMSKPNINFYQSSLLSAKIHGTTFQEYS